MNGHNRNVSICIGILCFHYKCNKSYLSNTNIKTKLAYYKNNKLYSLTIKTT